MSTADIAVQIKSLRAQLDVLEAKLRRGADAQVPSLADLKGLLAGESQSTEEEIDAALYRMPADKQP
jgi:hypothetical protein